MDAVFHINHALDVPIYQQLVDVLSAQIRSGQLAAGQRLPTVQALGQQLGIARGTIKRAYDELALHGLIEKGQGRGTFVCYEPVNPESHKTQAMQAIEELLTRLEAMGFSAAEISIFLNLKLRERAEQEASVKVAVLECNPENLEQICLQLRQLGQVDLYPCLLERFEEYPYQLNEEADLIVTTEAHAALLERMLPVRNRLVRVALRLSQSSFSEIVRLRRGTRVGILSYSDRFGALLLETCRAYTDGVLLAQPQVCTPELDLEGFLCDCDVLLVPTAFEKLFQPAAAECLRRFARKRRLIPCHYELDEGSSLYLRIKTQRILEEKAI